MTVNLKSMGAAKAKAQFLALLDEVEAKREPVIITKNGKAVARVVPMPLLDEDPIFGFYQGNLDIMGDVISPIYTNGEQDDFDTRSIMTLGGMYDVEGESDAAA